MLDETHDESAAFQDGGHIIRGRLVLTTISEDSDDSEDLPLMDVNPLVRFPLLLLNLVVWLVGVALSVLSALLLLRSLEAHEDAEALRRGELGALLMSHLEVTLLAAGLLLSAVSCCGCMGALRENTCLLRTYSFALLALIVASSLLGTLVLFMPAGAKGAIQRTLSAALVVHYRDSPDSQQLVDAVQRHLGCCGMTSKNFRDWNDNIYFNCSADNPSHERCSVPHSCCKRNASLLTARPPIGSVHCGRGVLNMSDYEAWFHINWNNCADTALHLLRKHAMAVCGGCLALSLSLAFLDALAHTTRTEIGLIRAYYARHGLAA